MRIRERVALEEGVDVDGVVGDRVWERRSFRRFLGGGICGGDVLRD